MSSSDTPTQNQFDRRFARTTYSTGSKYCCTGTILLYSREAFRACTLVLMFHIKQLSWGTTLTGKVECWRLTDGLDRPTDRSTDSLA